MQPEAYAQFTARLQQTLAADPRVIGFIAAGSMAAIDRQPDDFSDHDFFFITQPGEQEGFRQGISGCCVLLRIKTRCIESYLSFLRLRG